MINRIHQAHTGKRSVIRGIFSAVLMLLAVSLACSAVAKTWHLTGSKLAIVYCERL